MNKKMMEELGFEREINLVDKKCPFCEKDININEFRDMESVREYGISGLCQSCQDDFFGVKQ